MSVIKIETFGYENQDYTREVNAIVNVLKEALPEQFKQSVPDLTGITPEQWSIENYPRWWAETNRVGASGLTLPKEQLIAKKALLAADENIYFAHEIILMQLHQLRKQLRFSFNKDARVARRSIKICIADLNKQIEAEKLNFLYFTLQSTADSLKSNVSTLTNGKIIYNEEFNTALQVVDKDNKIIFKTANDSLNFTKRINHLSKSMLQQVNQHANSLPAITKPDDKPEEPAPAKQKTQVSYFSNETPAQRLTRQTQQVSVIAKRLADPFYTKPKELTTAEKVRRGFRIVTGVVAGLSGIAAIVSLAVAPPLAPIFLLVAMVGLYSTGDDLFEFIRHLTHGRTPTKSQTFAYLASIPAAVLYFLGGHITILATHLAKFSTWIGHKILEAMPVFQSISNFINRKVHYATNLASFKDVVDQIQLQPIAEATVLGMAVKQPAKAAAVTSEKQKGLHFFSPSENDLPKKFIVMRAKSILNKWQNIPEHESEKFANNHASVINDLLDKIKRLSVSKNHKDYETIKAVEFALRGIQTKGKPVSSEQRHENNPSILVL